MSSAGQQLISGRVPGEELAVVEETSGVNISTSEDVLMTLNATLVAGHTCWVKFIGNVGAGNAGDIIVCRMYEDSAAGNSLQQRAVYIGNNNTNGYPADLQGRYVVPANETKTFVVTGQRVGGSGTNSLRAASTRPCFLFVEYVSG